MSGHACRISQTPGTNHFDHFDHFDGGLPVITPHSAVHTYVFVNGTFLFRED